MTDPKTAVFLTDKESALIVLLSKAGAREIKNGSVEVHFDHEGWPVKAKTTQFVELSPNHSIQGLTVVI